MTSDICQVLTQSYQGMYQYGSLDLRCSKLYDDDDDDTDDGACACVCAHAPFQAISSLNKYPLPLQTAKEAKILQNFGDGICKILDERLQQYYRDNGIDHRNVQSVLTT